MPHPMKLAEALEGLRTNGSPEAETVLLKIDSLCVVLSNLAGVHRRGARQIRSHSEPIAASLDQIADTVDKTVLSIKGL